MNPGSNATSAPMLPLAIAFYGVLMAAALLWSLWSGDSLWFATAQAQVEGVRPLRDVGAGLMLAVAMIFASQQITDRTQWGQELARALAAVIGKRSAPECVALAVVSGIAEEALFRGALQPQLGLVATSLLFGLAHFAPRRELLPWTAFAVITGFLLGALFEWSGNLVAPVVAHVGINAVNLRLLSNRYA